MLARVTTAAVVGIEAEPITVEADITSNVPKFFMVGLPDTAVTEAQERIRSAIKNTPGVDWPLQRITINLAPADLRKEGTGFDLALAMAIVCARGDAPLPPDSTCFLGELSLEGKLRPTSGVLPIVACLRDRGVDTFIVPEPNAAEAGLVHGVTVFPAQTLRDVVRHVRGRRLLDPYVPTASTVAASAPGVDLADIAGQPQAKRCLEIAAAGGHNVLLSGPPGSGKTLLARVLSGILPPLTDPEALEVTRIYSVAGLVDPDQPLLVERPFRSPHHTASTVAVVGGGSSPRPGEITLAHRGVLFLDEFPEFPRAVLEALRQPLEDGFVSVSRAQASVRFPARFTLLASQNPCPCGYLGDSAHRCRCTPSQLERYRRRVSGPLLDRIDLHCLVPRLPPEDLEAKVKSEPSSAVRDRVVLARKRQQQRFVGTELIANAEMRLVELKHYCALDDETLQLLRSAASVLQLSGRAYHRVMRVSRTIADLEGAERIDSQHVAEALQYRQRAG
ncbi:MAG: YifB family Mg chelatase-like AAA ATPase [Candidatus Kerfeldbacteria bacterium]|nr:YifB family Mg chelatase-like AAA ATPase [Candidatus Kerfeldbacteria bacterium]